MYVRSSTSLCPALHNYCILLMSLEPIPVYPCLQKRNAMLFGKWFPTFSQDHVLFISYKQAGHHKKKRLLLHPWRWRYYSYETSVPTASYPRKLEYLIQALVCLNNIWSFSSFAMMLTTFHLCTQIRRKENSTVGRAGHKLKILDTWNTALRRSTLLRCRNVNRIQQTRKR